MRKRRREPVFVLPDGKRIFLEPGGPGRAQPRFYFREGRRVVWYHVWLAGTRLRPLSRGEVVHHKDGNSLNNAIGNLQIMTRAEHVRVHTPVKGYRFTAEQRKRLSDAHVGQRAWNKGAVGLKHSAEARANMSAAQRGRGITWGAKIAVAKTRVTKEQLLHFVSENPHCRGSDVKDAFKLNSNTAIHRHGGLRRLKKEAKV